MTTRPHRPGLSHWRSLLGRGVLAAGGALLLAGPAAALDDAGPGASTGGGDWLLVDVAGDEAGLVAMDETPALRFDRLAPGHGVSHDLILVTRSENGVRLGLGVSDVQPGEGGCIAPEVHAGDVSCGRDEGELQDWLWLRVERRGSDPTVIAEGRLSDLVAEDLDLGPLEPGSPLPVRLQVSLDPDAGNDTMSDTLGFTLRWRGSDQLVVVSPAGGAGASSGPGGTATGAAGSIGGRHVDGATLAVLPDTGAGVGLLPLGLGAGLVALGSALVRSGRRPVVRCGTGRERSHQIR